jgi:hypothetical protein
MKELFEKIEVRRKDDGELFCRMPRIAWVLTEPKSPLSFMDGSIIMSYACDPECKHGLFRHLWDAFMVWWRYLR